MSNKEITDEIISGANDLRKISPLSEDGKIIRDSLVHFLLRDIIGNDFGKIDLYYFLASSIAKIKELKDNKTKE